MHVQSLWKELYSKLFPIKTFNTKTHGNRTIICINVATIFMLGQSSLTHSHGLNMFHIYNDVNRLHSKKCKRWLNDVHVEGRSMSVRSPDRIECRTNCRTEPSTMKKTYYFEHIYIHLFNQSNIR